MNASPPSSEPKNDPADEAASQRRKKLLIVVAFTLFLDFVGFGMILPILPLFAKDLRATPEEVALLTTAFSLAQFVMSPVLGRWSDRYGRRPIMLLSIAGAIGSALIVGWAQSLWVIFAGRLFAGVCKSNISTAMAIVSDSVRAEQRAKYMGMMGAAIGMGFVFGPAIGGELSHAQFVTLPFFVSAGLSALNLVMAWFWLPETLPREAREANAAQAASGEQGPSRWQRVRASWGSALGWLFLICLIFYVSFAAMESVFALYNEAIWGWDAKGTGRTLGFIGLVVALVQGGVVPRLLPRLGEARSLALGLLLMGVGLGAMGLTPSLELGSAQEGPSTLGLAFYLYAGFMIAAGNAIVSASSSVLISLLSSVQEQGLNMGLRESASAVGRIVGPVAGGVAFGQVSAAAPMYLAALLCLLCLPLAFRLRVEKSLSKS